MVVETVAQIAQPVVAVEIDKADLTAGYIISIFEKYDLYARAYVLLSHGGVCAIGAVILDDVLEGEWPDNSDELNDKVMIKKYGLTFVMEVEHGFDRTVKEKLGTVYDVLDPFYSEEARRAFELGRDVALGLYALGRVK